jgi:hypothetical protein
MTQDDGLRHPARIPQPIQPIIRIAGSSLQGVGILSHAIVSRRFPYAVYYKMDGNVPVIWRVLDLRRDPERIRQELQ